MGIAEYAGVRGPVMSPPSPPSLFVVVVGLLLLISPLASGATDPVIPPEFTVLQGEVECLYDNFVPGDSATASVFIIGGKSRMRGALTFEGPVAPSSVLVGAELHTEVLAFEASKVRKDIIEKTTKIGGHLNTSPIDFEENFDDDYDYDDDDDDWYDDDDYAFTGDGPVENPTAAQKASADRKRKTRQAENERKKEINKQRERDRRLKPRPHESDPWQKTYDIEVGGWYRACLSASIDEIIAEMELRKSSDLGGKDEETHHVLSYDRRSLLSQEVEMKKMSDDYRGGDGAGGDDLKESDLDLESTQDKINEFNRIIHKIQKRQTEERHTLIVHAAVNERSHSGMVKSSLTETVIFILVTAFQMYTIRRWFNNTGPMLGR